MLSQCLFKQDDYYYSSSELRRGRFKAIGENVFIAKNCTVIGEENISIQDNVRIDGYSTIIATGFLHLGSFIHIGSYCHLSAADGIIIEDFTGLSQGVYVYSRSDDYSGHCMTNPMVPEEYTGCIKGTVILKRHVIIGARSVIMPNVVIEEGSAVGALSLVKDNLKEWGIYGGCPVRRIKNRSRDLLDLENNLLSR